MEAAPTEASFPLSPGGSSQSSGREKEDAAPASTSSTAREVEEELLLPTSTSLASEEDTVLPRSTSFAGQEDLPDTSLPPSSESPDPQGPSPSEPSSAPLESSPFAFSSPSPSPSTSPLSWKASSDGLQQLLEEEEEGRGEQAGAGAGAWLSPGGRAEQKKAKKKAPPVKKGAPGYTVRAIVPAEKEELVSVARAMHREKFAKNVKELFHLEKEAALKSIQTGLYIGWRCPEYLWDCFRVGDESRCFCGHLLKLHQVYVAYSVFQRNEPLCPAPLQTANARDSCSFLRAQRRWVNSGFGEELALMWQPGEQNASASTRTRNTCQLEHVDAVSEAALARCLHPASCVQLVIGAGRSTKPSLSRRRRAAKAPGGSCRKTTRRLEGSLTTRPGAPWEAIKGACSAGVSAAVSSEP
ncbi:protein FAM221B isoform 7-T7 [Liasis olivaceus]